MVVPEFPSPCQVQATLPSTVTFLTYRESAEEPSTTKEPSEVSLTSSKESSATLSRFNTRPVLGSRTTPDLIPRQPSTPLPPNAHCIDPSRVVSHITVPSAIDIAWAFVEVVLQVHRR